MKILLTLIILTSSLFGCETTEQIVSFNGDIKRTGIYESDPNGNSHRLLDDSTRTFALKSEPTIPALEFSELKIDNEFCYEEMCISFQLSENGTKKYAELTDRNIGKQIFYVIDGVIISAPIVADAIRSGGGAFQIKEKYFDSLFVVK